MRGIAQLARVFALLALAGCSAEPGLRVDALDMPAAPEELAEIGLGDYRIPIPVTTEHGHPDPRHWHLFQLSFNLHALVPPMSVPYVKAAWNRHEGKIRDHVIRIFRNATVDELQEPELTTIKTRLLEQLVAHMEGGDVRQLLMTDIVSQRL